MKSKREYLEFFFSISCSRDYEEEVKSKLDLENCKTIYSTVLKNYTLKSIDTCESFDENQEYRIELIPFTYPDKITMRSFYLSKTFTSKICDFLIRTGKYNITELYKSQIYRRKILIHFLSTMFLLADGKTFSKCRLTKEGFFAKKR